MTLNSLLASHSPYVIRLHWNWSSDNLEQIRLAKPLGNLPKPERGSKLYSSLREVAPGIIKFVTDILHKLSFRVQVRLNARAGPPDLLTIC